MISLIKNIKEDNYEEMNRRQTISDAWIHGENFQEIYNKLDEIPEKLNQMPRNREQKRHGIYGKDGYKRPKSNQKFYH